jgi:hypothetical protein
MTAMLAAIERLVRERAGGICEYCRLRQAFSEYLFVIDHIIARQHGGETEEANLAVCCVFCNRHKGPNVAGVDPETGNIIPLFNPRNQHWNDHFRWEGPTLIGTTASGRATIRALAMNHGNQWAKRSVLLSEGRSPCG